MLLRSVVVRPAGIDDLVHARQLLSRAFRKLSSAHYEIAKAATMQTVLESAGFVDALRGRALTLAWLSAVPVAVGGWLPAPTGGRVARLGTIGVDPMFTGLGLGRLIVTQVEGSARSAGFHELIAQVPWPLVEFHRKLGYVSTLPPQRAETGGESPHASCLSQTTMHKRLIPTEVDHEARDRVMRNKAIRATHTSGHQRAVALPAELVLKRMPSKAMH